MLPSVTHDLAVTANEFEEFLRRHLGSGRYGTTRDYAQATFDELRRQGIHDRALARLLALSFPKS